MANRKWDFTGQLLENGKRVVTDQVATTSIAGLMSAADKTKLDKLSDDATSDYNDLSNKPILVNTSEYWNAQSSFVPSLGSIIVYTDGLAYTDGQTSTTTYQPTIKIGDGTTLVSNLKFYNESATLRHSLTIGTTTFDGSVDVAVPVYDGSIK